MTDQEGPMSDLFQSVTSVETAVDVAIRLEQIGRDFYRDCLDSVSDPDLMDVFSFLAAEEEKHLGIYRQLLDSISEPGSYQQVELPGEYGAYVDMLASEIAWWLSPDEQSGSAEALKAAMNFEKNTLLMYMEMKELFTGRDADIIEKICKEEKKHITMIGQYMKSHP